MPTPTTAKKRPFPLGRVREIAAHVKNLHECLSDVLAEYDSAPTGESPKASDNSDAGETWAEQGQDSARRRPGSMNIGQLITNARTSVSR
jgi:hypothetical protein